MKLLILFVAAFISLFLLPESVHAQNPPFEQSIDVLYKINESGQTSVTQNIRLTNLSTEIYPSKYILKMGPSNITNLHAWDSEGAIEIVDNSDENRTELVFNFNERVVGQGKTLHWSLNYDQPDITRSNGRLWQIFIPPVQFSPHTKSYTVDVYVPPSFKTPLYQKPKPNFGSSLYSLSPDHNFGINLTYLKTGSIENPYQPYDFTLKYHLKNQGITSLTQKIAIPPDTSYQKVYIGSIKPSPQNVIQDDDGNWIATFILKPSSNLDVTVSGTVITFLSPKKEPLSKPSSYLNSDKYWETLDPEIKSLANSLNSPKKIYDFVVNHLNYDKSRILNKKTRLGARNVLKNPQSAICMEFTDLFIALSRAAGIPAREIDGFGNTQDLNYQPLSGRDVLHAWPQFYDFQTQSWRMVDPTWSKTTQGIDYFDIWDFDHITFAIRGTSSTYPPPAGSYKITETAFGQISPSKDLLITPSQASQDSFKSSPPEIIIDPNLILFTPFPLTTKLEVYNPGPGSLNNFDISLDSNLEISPNTINISSLPPFGRQQIPITIRPLGIFNESGFNFYINSADITLKKTVTVKHFYKSNGFLAVLSVLVFFLFLATRLVKHLFVH